MRDMPVRIISDGVVTRSVRDTAAFFREAELVYRNLALPPIGDITRPGRKRLRIARAPPTGAGVSASPEVAALTLEVGGAARGARATGSRRSRRRCRDSFPDDFLLYWALLAFFLVRTGRRQHGRSWDRDQSRPPHARARPPRGPQPAPRARGDPAAEALDGALGGVLPTYDVTLMPDAGHRDAAASGTWTRRSATTTIMERLLDWVAFTPLQNATGDPAISLPLATTAAGLPPGMMFGAPAGPRGGAPRARLRARGGAAVRLGSRTLETPVEMPMPRSRRGASEPISPFV